MKNDERMAWLTSDAAQELRKTFTKQAKLSVDSLMAAAIVSTDPVVRMHAAAYLAWQKAHKELEPQHEPD